MNRKFLYRVSLLCVCISLISSAINAQSEEEVPTLTWLDAGIGVSTVGGGGGAASLGFTLQIYDIVYGIQYCSHSYSNSFIFATESKEFSDFGALVGIATRDSSFHASASAGIAVVWGSKKKSSGGFFTGSKTVKTEYGPSFGFLLGSQLFWKAGKNFGIGLKFFIDLNKNDGLTGLTLSIFLGEFY